MATFTTEEVDYMKEHGNDLCAKTWLGLWDPKRVHTQDQRELIIEKYERKRYKSVVFLNCLHLATVA